MEKGATKEKEVGARWFWIGAIASFCLPLVAKLVFSLPWVMLQNFTDGVFYLGYSLRFRELVEQAGMLYYAVRFPAIAGDALAFSALGLPLGFVVTRYLLAGVSCAVLFWLFARRYEIRVGFFAAVAWGLNPAAIRFLQTDYSDVEGASFLCIGASLLLLPNLRWGLASFGGAVFCAGCWCHLHAAMAAFFLIPAVVLVRWEDGWKRTLLLAGAAVGGGGVLTVGASLWYGWNYGVFDLTAPTREILELIAAKKVPVPDLTWREVVERCPFWFGIFPAGVALACLGRKADRVIFGGFLGFFAYVGLLFFGDVVHGGYSLSLFYYYSFALPAWVFFHAGLAGVLLRGKGWRAWLALLLGLVIPVVCSAWKKSDGGGWLLWAGGILCALSLLPFRKAWREAAAVFCLWAGMALIAFTPTCWLALGNYWKTDDLGVLGMAEQLLGELPPRAKGENLFFWYDDSRGDSLRMLQSLFLHNFTKAQSKQSGIFSFPEDPDLSGWALKKAGVRHLVLLGKDEKEMEAGLKYLEGCGADIEVQKKIPLRYGGDRMEACYLRVGPWKIKESEKIEGEWNIHKKAKKKNKGEGFSLVTRPERRWSNAALPLPEMGENQAVEIEIQGKAGMVTVTIESKKTKGLAGEKFLVSPSEEPVRLLVFPPETGGGQELRIANEAPGVASRVEVFSVRLVTVE